MNHPVNKEQSYYMLEILSINHPIAQTPETTVSGARGVESALALLPGKKVLHDHADASEPAASAR
jgi:hypothetical protein